MNIRSALHIISLIIVVTLSISACTAAKTTASSDGTLIHLPHSSKGYELYSWLENNLWHFTLITGTNRVKSLDEIISNGNVMGADGWVKISVEGVDAIQKLISGLPQHEDIFWVDRLGQAQTEAIQITFPPQEMIDAVQETCNRLDLGLHMSK